VPMMLVW